MELKKEATEEIERLASTGQLEPRPGNAKSSFCSYSSSLEVELVKF